jgi:hypothetical protein
MDILKRAGDFLAAHGRPIDQARYAVHFGGADQESLLMALAHYQNVDGGFGHGLEPDISAPDSNPFATEMALAICREARVANAHPLIERAVEYLEATQDEDGGWRLSVEVQAHALAPWFAGWVWPNLNPACVIAGLLRELGVGSQRLHARVEQLFVAHAQLADLATGAFYDVRPYAGYFLTPNAHPRRELYLAGILWWVIRTHLAGEFPSAGHFFAYVPDPESYTGHHLPAAIIAEQLDRLEAEQEPDGGWPTPYAEHWRAPATVQSLLTLRAFGRI